MSRITRAYRELDELYAQIPPLECKGLCHDSCTAIDMSLLERRRITEAGGKLAPPISAARVRQLKAEGNVPRCPSLGPLNTCAIYPLRPWICRVFGAAADLRCEHGCIPDSILEPGEAARIMVRIEELSRQVLGEPSPLPSL